MICEGCIYFFDNWFCKKYWKCNLSEATECEERDGKTHEQSNTCGAANF